MRDLALDPATGDIALTFGSDGLRRAAVTTPGGSAVRQKLALRLGLVQGEYPFDTGVGVPLFDLVLRKASGAAAAEALYRRAVATCPGVRSVDAFRFALGADRRATITTRVTADDGTSVTVTDFVP